MNKECKICGDNQDIKRICSKCYGTQKHIEAEKEKSREEGKNEMAQECYREVRSMGNRSYPLRDLYEKEIKERILKKFEKTFPDFNLIATDLDEIKEIINKS